MSASDIATAVAEFAAEPSRTSLQLPHMTTGQRKATKKLLEQYPELRCESYGFGAERQLHLFKEGAVESQQQECGQVSDRTCDLTTAAVVVKNTFIDDWAGPKPEAVVFRSLQFRSAGKDLASMAKASIQLEACPDRLTPELENFSKGYTCVSSSPVPVLPVMDEELQVRNTFIHFEKGIDRRAVQSMPHGMFKQCLLAESSQMAMGYETPTTMGCNTPTSASEADLDFMRLPVDEGQGGKDLCLAPGALVVVEGLVKVPAFNGRSAVIQGWDEETGRYDILLASTDGSQQAKIKEENLRMILPCP